METQQEIYNQFSRFHTPKVKKKERKKEREKERKQEFSYIQLKSNMKSSTRSIYFYNHFKVPLIVF